MVNSAVFYFSASGVTANVAHRLAVGICADIYAITPKEKYTEQDLDWHDPQSRSSLEMKDLTCRPDFECEVGSLDKYKTVWIGFPIWWYEAPRIIQSFLERYDFSDKTVIPFATSGSSGLCNTEAILQKSAPKAHWLAGRRLDAEVSVKELVDWAESNGV